MTRSAAFALLAAACGGGTTPPPPVSVGLQFDQASCIEYCLGVDDCPLNCNGEVGVFLIDGETGASFDQACVEIVGGMAQTLRDLAAYVEQVAFEVEPGRTMAIELVVYPGAVGCPRPDLVEGTWSNPTGGVPPLYAGRSPIYTIGDDLASILVPVQCVSPLELCETVETTYSARLFDLATLQEDGSLAPNTVDVRTAFRVPIGMVPEQYVLTPDVELEHLVESVWEAESSFTQFDECYGTLVTRIGVGLVPTLGACEGLQIGDRIEASTYHLDKVHVDGILEALGMATLPDEGLVIGRIASGLTEPDETKTIRAVTPTTTMDVVYLDTDGSGLFTVVERGSWFVIRDMTVDDGMFQGGKCCDTLEIVDDQGAGTGFFSTFRVGLIRGIVMAVVVTS